MKLMPTLAPIARMQPQVHPADLGGLWILFEQCGPNLNGGVKTVDAKTATRIRLLQIALLQVIAENNKMKRRIRVRASKTQTLTRSEPELIMEFSQYVHQFVIAVSTACACGAFDFIYASGLYDHPGAPLAKRVTVELSDLFGDGGSLLVANLVLDIYESPTWRQVPVGG